jgi:hypothetical protein
MVTALSLLNSSVTQSEQDSFLSSEGEEETASRVSYPCGGPDRSRHVQTHLVTPLQGNVPLPLERRSQELATATRKHPYLGQEH